MGFQAPGTLPDAHVAAPAACPQADDGVRAGGRASTRTREEQGVAYDHGAQFVRVSERLQPAFAALQRRARPLRRRLPAACVCAHLGQHPAQTAPRRAPAARAGVAAPWQGRLGSLDASTGSFSPNVPSGSAFCGFGQRQRLYVGVPSMSALCYAAASHEAVTPHWACKARLPAPHLSSSSPALPIPCWLLPSAAAARCQSCSQAAGWRR